MKTVNARNDIGGENKTTNRSDDKTQKKQSEKLCEVI